MQKVRSVRKPTTSTIIRCLKGRDWQLYLLDTRLCTQEELTFKATRMVCEGSGSSRAAAGALVRGTHGVHRRLHPAFTQVHAK